MIFKSLVDKWKLWRLGKRRRRDHLLDLRPDIPDRFLGCCYRCRVTWKWVDGHNTNYSNGSGCFPLCEECWSELTPKDRLPFYDALVNEWIRQDLQYGHKVGREKYEQDRKLIHAAVLAGK